MVRILWGSRRGLRRPSLHRPIYGGFGYIAVPRLALGVNVHLPRDLPRDTNDPRGIPRNGKMADPPLVSFILGAPCRSFVSFRRHAIYGVFAYLAPRAWCRALMPTPTGRLPGSRRLIPPLFGFWANFEGEMDGAEC